MNNRFENIKNEISPDDEVIKKTLEKANNIKRLPKKVEAIISAAACVAVIIVAAAVAFNFTNTNVPVMETTQTDGSNAACYIQPWSEMTILERFSFFIYNGNEYDSAVTHTVMTQADISEKITDIVMTAHNHDENIDVSINASLYGIKGVNKNAYIALKYDGDESYYGFHNVNYRPETIGQLDEDTGLFSSLKIGETDIHRIENGMANMDKTYTVEDTHKIVEIIRSAADAVSCDRDKYSVTYIDMRECRIGLFEDGDSIGISDNGYIKFGFVGEDTIYFIGEQAVRQIKEIIEANGTVISEIRNK